MRFLKSHQCLASEAWESNIARLPTHSFGNLASNRRLLGPNARRQRCAWAIEFNSLEAEGSGVRFAILEVRSFKLSHGIANRTPDPASASDPSVSCSYLSLRTIITVTNKIEAHRNNITSDAECHSVQIKDSPDQSLNSWCCRLPM